MKARKALGIKHLERLRKKHGLRGLARRLGIFHGSIQHALERNEIQPGLAIRMHREFGIPLEELGH